MSFKDGSISGWLYPRDVRKISREEMVRKQREERSSERPTRGSCVEVLSGDHLGRCGEIIQDEHDSTPYRVRFGDGSESDWLRQDCVRVTSRDRMARKQQEELLTRFYFF